MTNTETLPTTEAAFNFAKRLIYLAWKASGVPQGMGRLQDRGPGLSEDEVWEIASGSLDYPSNRNTESRTFCDYVAGRMMKLAVDVKEVEGGAEVVISEGPYRGDYQGFVGKYESPEALLSATRESFAEVVSE